MFSYAFYQSTWPIFVKWMNKPVRTWVHLNLCMWTQKAWTQVCNLGLSVSIYLPQLLQDGAVVSLSCLNFSQYHLTGPCRWQSRCPATNWAALPLDWTPARSQMQHSSGLSPRLYCPSANPGPQRWQGSVLPTPGGPSACPCREGTHFMDQNTFILLCPWDMLEPQYHVERAKSLSEGLGLFSWFLPLRAMVSWDIDVRCHLVTLGTTKASTESWKPGVCVCVFLRDQHTSTVSSMFWPWSQPWGSRGTDQAFTGPRDLSSENQGSSRTGAKSEWTFWLLSFEKHKENKMTPEDKEEHLEDRQRR
jgi:hypothetical protein